jgi:hypothetical protein
MLYSILSLFGYETGILKRLDRKNFHGIYWSTSLVLISCLLFSISVAYIAFVAAYSESTKIELGIGLVVFVGVFVFIFNARRLFILTGGFPIHREDNQLDSWRPDRLRLIALFFVAVLASQSLSLMVKHPFIEDQISEQINARVSNFEFTEKSYLDNQKSELLLTLKAIGERINKLPIEEKPLSSDIKVKSEALPEKIKGDGIRKALVIGESNYNYPIEYLKNTKNDANRMKTTLEKIGFDVTFSLDDTKFTLDHKIRVYIDSLKPGDISAVFYAGHGFQENGHNYLVPIDFKHPIDTNSIQSSAVKVTQIIEQVGQTKPQLNLVILDACRSFVGAKHGGLAHIQSEDSRNVVIVTASGPGQEAQDGVNGQEDSPFTTAWLKYISNEEDISKIIRRVTESVVAQTSRNGEIPQLPWSTSTLTNPDVQIASSVFLHKDEKAITQKSETLNNEYQKPSNETQTNEKGNSLCPRVNVEIERTCLKSEKMLAERKLNELNDEYDYLINKKLAWYRDSLEDLGMLSDRLYILWSDKLEASLYTLIFVLILTLGDFIRDFLWLKPLREYERIKHHQSRVYVKQNFKDVESKIEVALSKYASFTKRNFPKINPWDDRTDFYKQSFDNVSVNSTIDNFKKFQELTEQLSFENTIKT